MACSGSLAVTVAVAVAVRDYQDYPERGLGQFNTAVRNGAGVSTSACLLIRLVLVLSREVRCPASSQLIDAIVPPHLALLCLAPQVGRDPRRARALRHDDTEFFSRVNTTRTTPNHNVFVLVLLSLYANVVRIRF